MADFVTKVQNCSALIFSSETKVTVGHDPEDFPLTRREIIESIQGKTAGRVRRSENRRVSRPVGATLRP
jgi:hypothetical protein